MTWQDPAACEEPCRRGWYCYSKRCMRLYELQRGYIKLAHWHQPVRGDRYSLYAYGNLLRNFALISAAWRRFDALNAASHEVRRALLRIDKPPVGEPDRAEFYARLRRYVIACRQYPVPGLP